MFSAAKAGIGGLAAIGVLKNNPLDILTVKAGCNPDCEAKYVGDVIKKKVGFPQPTACCKPLRFKDFIISYDSRNRIPNWVYEHLTYDKLFKDDPCDRRVKVERQQCKSNEDEHRPKFIPDCRIHGYHRADARDYCDTDYEMGLLAQPENYPYDCEAFCECFTMTNIVPQLPGFNCGPWFDLECYVREKLARENKSVYVCSGPLFLPLVGDDDKTQKIFDVLGDGEVSVPTHYFKVIVIETHDGQLELETYMMPNCTPEEGNEAKLEEYLTPLNQIEHHSGLIFFPEKKCFSSNNRRRGCRLHAL